MKKYTVYFVLLTALMVSYTSCSKDEDDDGTDAPEYVEPSIIDRSVVIEAPAGLTSLANSGDIYATLALSYFNLANSIGNYASSFVVPTDVDPQLTNNGNALYSWSHAGYSYWMTFSEDNGKYSWKYEYEMPGYPRFTYIEAEESKDGKSGSWTIYDPDSPSEDVWMYNWSMDSNDNFSATLTFNEDDAETSVFTVSSNVDESGSFVYTVNGTDEVEIHWNADGSGNYWFNNDGEEVTNTWPAQ